MNPDSKLIAVDFDGTIVHDNYPKIGKPMPFAFDTLKMLKNDGHRLILWTYRCGEKLREAIDFCEEKGVKFDAINASFEGEQFDGKKSSRKIHADLFIDDRNFGGFPGWGEIYQKLSGKEEQNSSSKKKKKRGIFGI